MFKQKQAGAGEPFGSAQGQDLLKMKPLSVQGPDVHEAMKMAGVKDVVLSAEQKRANGSNARGREHERQYRPLCCCGVRGCGIGPMSQVEEVT